MVELIRTVRQWWATARRLDHREIGRADLAEQIRWAFSADPHAHPDTIIRVSFVEEDAAIIETRTPLAVWWMPKAPGGGAPPRVSAEEAGEAAVDAAESLIREHQRRPPET
ncbi:MAG: hypothetical protein M3R02_11715 [Chloroflexota bacterium]|nr:hypothetical protein [Chloroflexota bacterium]